MNRALSLTLLAASMALAAAATATAQQRSSQDNYVETGRDFRQSDRVTMGGNLLTAQEEQRFTEMRRQATGKQDLDRIEAEERALLNQRVAERIAAALEQPAGAGTPSTPSTAQSPNADRPFDRMPAQQAPYDPGATEGSMGR
jgi:TolA-binding protein